MNESLFRLALESRNTPLDSMTPAQAAALMLARRHCRSSLEHLVRWIGPLLADVGEYLLAPHHIKIIHALEKVERGARRVVISAPPRGGKSVLLIAGLAWMWGRHPAWPLAYASYAGGLAEEHSARFRRLLRSEEFKEIFPDFELDPTSQALALVRTTAGGVFVAVGRGGVLTGKGFRVGVADDLIANDDEARSATIKASAWSWFRSVFATRLTPPDEAAIIVCATRWAVDDPSGQILALSERGEGDHYEHLHFKALDTDSEGNEVALWPYTVASAHEARVRSGPRVWRSLYQNSPAYDGSGFFRPEWFTSRYVPQDLPQGARLVCSSDFALSPDAGDYTVHIVGAVVSNASSGADETYILDIWRKQTTFEDGVSGLIATLRRHRDVGIFIAEDDNIIKTGGVYLEERLRHANLRPHVVKLPRQGAKTAKAGPLQGMAEAGRLWLPVDAPWVDAFIDEHIAFDGEGSQHDDQVDAAANIVRGILAGRIKPRNKVPGQMEHLYDPAKPLGGHVELGRPGDRGMLIRALDTRDRI